MLGGTALASLVALNPLPLLFWLGSELVLLPMLDSGPLRRLVARRKRDIARAQAGAAARPRHRRPVAAARQALRGDGSSSAGMIEANYQGLTGISQAYLSEQRGKLDVILHGYLNRLMALQRYERMPRGAAPAEIEQEIEALEAELAAARPARARRGGAARRTSS